MKLSFTVVPKSLSDINTHTSTVVNTTHCNIRKVTKWHRSITLVSPPLGLRLGRTCLIGCEVAAKVGGLDIVYGVVTNYIQWKFLRSLNDKVVKSEK